MKGVIPDARQQAIPQGENAFKAILFIALLTASLYGGSWVGQWPNESLATTVAKYGLIIGLATVNAMLILAMAILAHEAVHKVLFRNPMINDWAGGLLSAFGLIPFYANRQFHLTHHRYAHQPGLDPEHQMHSRSFWFAFVVGPHVGIFLQHRLLLTNAWRSLREKQLRLRVLKDSLFLAVALGYYFGLLPILGISLLYSALPTLLLFPWVFSVRALSDHYGIPEVRPKSQLRKEVLEDNPELWPTIRDKRRIQPTGWVIHTPRWLEWLWSHVNYHEVHHKYPYLSHRHLKAVYEQTQASQPYIVGQGYWRNLLDLRRRPYYTKD